MPKTSPAAAKLSAAVVKAIKAKYELLLADDFAKLTAYKPSDHIEIFQLHRAGKLISLCLEGGRWFYPTFQLDADNNVLPVMAEIIAIGGTDRLHQENLTVWIMSPTDSLSGARPVDLLQTDPDRVVAAARQDLA